MAKSGLLADQDPDGLRPGQAGGRLRARWAAEPAAAPTEGRARRVRVPSVLRIHTPFFPTATWLGGSWRTWTWPMVPVEELMRTTRPEPESSAGRPRSVPTTHTPVSPIARSVGAKGSATCLLVPAPEHTKSTPSRVVNQTPSWSTAILWARAGAGTKGPPGATNLGSIRSRTFRVP